MRKQDVIDLLGDMPDEVDLDELMYRLYVLRKLQVSEESVKAGRIVSHDEAQRRINEWLR